MSTELVGGRQGSKAVDAARERMKRFICYAPLLAVNGKKSGEGKLLLQLLLQLVAGLPLPTKVK